MKIREIECKSAIGKCGFPGGGLAINPYVGCGHGCVYCYARFIKRFTGHTEKWGSFVDVRQNIADILEKQMKSPRYKGEKIYLGTVTDPYQPVEKKYGITREILRVLAKYENPVSILTKSDLVLRDLELLKKIKNLDVDFTVTTLCEKWRRLTEPNSSTIKERLKAMRKLVKKGITVFALIGPYWPIFTDAEALLKEFKRLGVSRVFAESLNTIGENWTGVEKALGGYYPKLLPEMKEIFFDKEKFQDFYNRAKKNLIRLSKKHKIPVKIHFGFGHTAKFK